jgi:NAD(P)-dependent dehydrogenase (short-subunit alcohol dehydrogenase family)
MSDLAGRTAIVTGGARGIGRAVCELLAERGCRLVVNYNASAAAAADLVAAVNAGGGEAVAVAGSIADPATGPALASAAIEAFGRIDILVNNAGVTRDATVRKMTDESRSGSGCSGGCRSAASPGPTRSPAPSPSSPRRATT